MRFCVQRKLYNDSAVYICKVWLFVLQQAHRESEEKTEKTVLKTSVNL